VNKNLGQPDKIVDIKPDIKDENVFWCAGWGSGWFKGRDSTGTSSIEVNSFPKNNSLHISTNPVTRNIKISLSKPERIKSVSLYSINGRMIKRRNISQSVSECIIETAIFPAGCLIVLVVTNSNRKIVKKVNIVSGRLIL
jgi:hypothetical protein